MEFAQHTRARIRRSLVLGTTLVTLGACSGTVSDDGWLDFDLDADLRGLSDGFTTADAARQARGAARPEPDARGIISYPTYQVAVAREGDTLTSLANRVGLPEAELSRYNGLNAGARLREGEIVALPRKVGNAGSVDVESLAGNALDRVGNTQSGQNAGTQSGEEPIRHQVVRGETAYSVARLYGVSVRALAEWNGLDGSLTVREGQYLLIPPKSADTQPANTRTGENSAPGVGTPTPLPPSSSAPLPEEQQAAADTATQTPQSPNLGNERTSNAQMAMPVDGRIVGAYVRGKSDGIDISASPGTTVRAARAGTVAAITRDTNDVPILVLRHEGNLLTVYAGISDIAVSKGDTVARGQQIAKVRASDNPALHFQVRQGTSSVDPMEYLN